MIEKNNKQLHVARCVIFYLQAQLVATYLLLLYLSLVVLIDPSEAVAEVRCSSSLNRHEPLHPHRRFSRLTALNNETSVKS